MWRHLSSSERAIIEGWDDGDTEPKKPRPPSTPVPVHRHEWITTPGGDIELTSTVKFIKTLLKPVDTNPKNNELLINCPKCHAYGLRAKKGIFGIIRILAGVCHVGSEKLNLNALKSHTENGKDVIAICLKCNHNRLPLSPFAVEQNAKEMRKK